MGSSLATVVLTLLLAARLCDFASIKEDPGFVIKKCTDLDANGNTLSKRCDDLNRICMDGTHWSSEATCGVCKKGFGKDPYDTDDTKLCWVITNCDSESSTPGKTWREICADRKRTCYDGSPISLSAKCGRCIDDFVDHPDHTDWCIPGCPDVSFLENGIASGICKNAPVDSQCVFDCSANTKLIGPAKLGCKMIAKDDDVALTWDAGKPKCVATSTCSDWMYNTTETWNSFCRKQEGRECTDVAPNQPPRCTCKDGCNENGNGACVCEQQKDKHSFLLKGLFSIFWERQ